VRTPTLVATTALLASLVAASTPLRAQWPKYPNPAVPRAASGEPNLDAPPPRTPDGKPDLSGVWTRAPGDGRGRGRGQNAAPPPPPPGTPPVATFGDLGTNMPDGLPLTPWGAELKKQRMALTSKDNPDANCLPMGMGQMNAHPFPRKIIQTPTEVVLIYEGSGTTVREAFLDGRTLPRDPEPWWNGYSVGRWEGDTLVIETTGFMDDGWLDVRGSPLTSGGKIIERFHRVKYGYLELEETIDDPKAYTKPFSAKLYYRLSPDTQLSEFVCLDKDAKHYVGASPAK
jgi:hypothetical protein